MSPVAATKVHGWDGSVAAEVWPYGFANRIITTRTMTINDRYTIDLSDLLRVRFECKACGAAISYDVEKWLKVPGNCPGCDALWMIHGEGPYRTMEQFSLAMRSLRAVKESSAYRLRFEVDRPTV
jgi:hypothetical protein